jgi:hypothetical protein
VSNAFFPLTLFSAWVYRHVRQSSLQRKGNYYGLLKTSLRHLVDFSRPARLGLRRLPAAAHHSVCDGWRMIEDDHAERISAISEKIKHSFYELGNGETPGDVMFAATMALACFIYDATNRGTENSIAKRCAELLVDAVTHIVKEDLN